MKWIVLSLFLALGYGADFSRHGDQTKQQTREFRLPFIDQAADVPGFAAFRDRLREAIKHRDARFLIDVSAPALRQRFMLGAATPESAGRPSIPDWEWKELETLLGLGGAVTTARGSVSGRPEFCAPYVYVTYPTPLNEVVERMAGHDQNPEGDPWAVLGDRVPVFERPSADAPVVEYLSYHLVKRSGNEAPASPPVRWYEVFTPTGRRAWISAEKLRNPSDYHACFADVDGGWKLVAFERD